MERRKAGNGARVAALWNLRRGGVSQGWGAGEPVEASYRLRGAGAGDREIIQDGEGAGRELGPAGDVCVYGRGAEEQGSGWEADAGLLKPGNRQPFSPRMLTIIRRARGEKGGQSPSLDRYRHAKIRTHASIIARKDRAHPGSRK